MLDFFYKMRIIINVPSGVVKIQRISVTVAHRTLTPFAGVRIPHPLPKIADLRQKVGDFYFFTINYSLFTKFYPAFFGK